MNVLIEDRTQQIVAGTLVILTMAFLFRATPVHEKAQVHKVNVCDNVLLCLLVNSAVGDIFKVKYRKLVLLRYIFQSNVYLQSFNIV
jgi:hypothetical protein